MSLPKSSHDLLMAIKSTKSGQLDVSKFSSEELDEAVEDIHATFRFKGGLTRIKNLDGDELEAAESIKNQFYEALTSGRVSYQQLANGRVGVGLGVEDNPQASSQISDPSISTISLRASAGAVKTYWWGLRIYINHSMAQGLVEGGLTASVVVATLGAPAWIAPIIGAAVAWIKASDKNGRGIYLYVTWATVWWIGPA